MRRPELQRPALARPLRVERLHQVVRHLRPDSLQAARWSPVVLQLRAVYLPVVKQMPVARPAVRQRADNQRRVAWVAMWPAVKSLWEA